MEMFGYIGAFLAGLTICFAVIIIFISNAVNRRKYRDYIAFEHLPFAPCKRQIIYIEKEYNSTINSFIKVNYDSICERFQQYGYEFCYLPYLPQKLGSEKRLNYWAPYTNDTETVSIESNYLLDFATPKSRETVEPSLIYYCDDVDKGDWPDKYLVFRKIEIDSSRDIESSFNALLNTFQEEIVDTPKINDPYYELNEDDADYTDARYETTQIDTDTHEGKADARYSLKDNHEMYDYVMAEYPDKETQQLLNEIDARVAVLAQKGISEHILQQIVAKPAVVSRMVITPDNRIILSDYDNMEIKMSPLVKAVYFLFLYHPEGIVYKHLTDYREELIDIYENIKGEPLSPVMLRSITDVTDPMKNSINEKVARIREAFVTRFDERLAVNYIIRGERGESKRIPLHREFVEWQ